MTIVYDDCQEFPVMVCRVAAETALMVLKEDGEGCKILPLSGRAELEGRRHIYLIGIMIYMPNLWRKVFDVVISHLSSWERRKFVAALTQR